MLKNLFLDVNHLKMEDMERLTALKYLEYLDVSWNEIAGTFDLALLGKMKNLKNCWLASNQIDKLENTMIDGHPELTDLILSHNLLETVNFSVFAKFSQLRYLWLNMNRIFKIDGYSDVKTVLPNIYLVNILENMWICEDLEDIVGAFKKESIKWHSLEKHHCNSNNKNRLYEGACCYPNITDLKKDSEEIYQKVIALKN